MKFQALFVPILFLLSCDLRPEEDRIRIPKVTNSFYESAAARLEGELKADPANASLIELQLSYYERLNWPAEAEACVLRAMEELDLEPVVSKKYADFFMKNGQYDSFLQLSRDLQERFEKPDWVWEYQIVAANRLGLYEEAKTYLRRYFTLTAHEEAHFFGGLEYLKAQDSLLSFYHLQQVKDLYANDREFVATYVPLAYHSKAYHEVLAAIEVYEAKALDITLKFKALALYELERRDEAKQLLWSIPGKENLLTLSDWYIHERRWDSSYLALDRVLLQNPDDLDVLMRKGWMDDLRGLFSRASTTFIHVLSIDSSHQEARDMLDLVNRKIAYLRRIRDSSQEIPTIELNSKKAIQ